ncbi:MAG: ABC transporter substrate-binding protein [Dehalococcoidales bacterium]|nr:ABC transporter substrate-binding protein [Dehalococcoidales bacterium]MDD3264677.1 ABC transporter substrate-binding protein [Dehalococcoidales bacterium]MDD4322666.1 ABC transporter substrate-binding protein [Dehalococcoidales bacterium]MDD4794226.1 ABC transporter substrate-binding protein [Dehalococcoidales bacterium]MDD5498519.1 ABC transporter substrate-binding protein [Dehalococcoidales bacterium]
MKLKPWRILGIIAVVIVITALILPGCQTDKPPIKNPDTFIAASIGGPETLDPAAAYDSASGEVLQLVYEPLVYYKGEKTDEYEGILADEWEVSRDGMTYRFHIREGVTFHNGNELTPEDVEYTFERALVQDYVGAPTWMLYEPLLGIGTNSHVGDDLRPLSDLTSTVEVVEDGWVEFYLASPYEPFIQIIAGFWGGIMDKEWCIENGDWDGTQQSYEALNNPAANAWPLDLLTNGTGPFKLDYWDKAVEVSLVRNDNYWREPASFERVLIKDVPEWTTRKLMLQNGDCDWAYVPTLNYLEMEGAEGIKVYEDLPLVQCEGFFFNFDISPDSQFVGSGQLDGNGIPLDFFADIDVRKGFTYCFDWEAYIDDAMMGYGIQPASPVVKGLAYYNPDLDTYYENDMAKAEQHFKAAFGGEVWDKGFTLTLAYNSGNDTRKVACEILADNINSLNPKFNVTAAPQEWTSYGAQMYARILPCFQIGWIPDFFDAHNFIYTWMHEGGYWAYYQSYNNQEATDKVEQAIASIDPDERQALYDELAQIHYDDCPGILLVQPTGNRFFKDWVKGYFFNPADSANYGQLYKMSKEY